MAATGASEINVTNHAAVVPPTRRGCYFLRMANLFLAPTMRCFGIGDSNDYVVLEGGRVIGRILLHPQAPEGHPWFWTITSMEYPPSVYNKGYSATREQAMADFKARRLAH
jgi:hypothetical protein